MGRQAEREVQDTRRKKMENYITCSQCKRKISNNPLIDAAANKGYVGKDNLGSQFITCECGNNITFWAITAQLRAQNTLGSKIQNFFRPHSQSRQ
jgi:transcription elongation factor Elf1